MKRIEGQVRVLQGMIEDDRYCIHILTQLNSITAALKAVGVGLLDGHARNCLRESFEQGEGDAKVDEMVAATPGSWAGKRRIDGGTPEKDFRLDVSP